nr:carboxypeptidase regulatory-like domain-containing protein [Candidatus Wallbacteria bacterium]
MKKNQLFSFRGIVSLLITLLAAAALTAGCGGGGGSSSAPVEDIGPIVSIIEGYVYVPSSGTAAPLNAAQKAVENLPVLKNQPLQADTNKVTPPAAKPSPDLKSNAATKETSEASVKSSSAAVSRASIIPTSGYVPLTGATVQLGGTNKATVTNPTGYYRFEIGQKEIMAFGTKKLMINKPEANVSIEFEVAIVSGDSRYIHTEINTKTGEKTVKEVLTNRVQSPFIFVSGRATGATGVALAGAAITAVKVSNTSFTKTAYADSYGRYSFSELTDGLYTLTVVKENYKTTSKNVEVSSTYTLSNIDFIIPGTFSVSPRAVTPELSSVKIVYATSVPTSYTIEYGLSSTYLYSSTSNLYNLTNEITLTNLSPKTVYHYKIKAVDQYGNTINTDDATFETLDPNTNSKEAPIVNSNYTVRKTHNSITVTFNTNMSSYAQIEYAVSSASVYARYPADGSEIGPQSNFELTVPNLTNSTTYKFFIVTKNIANKSVFRREPQQLPVQVTTDNSPDITPPVISGVTVTDLKAKEAVINFSSIDIHENIRNNTDAKIYYGLASYPVLQYDFSVIPPRVRLDYYQKISETLPFNFDSQKVIKLTGLEPSKKYYFRPASNDPSGNIGTVTDEISFTTAAPGTALTFALSESPAAGQISVGEHAKIFRLIAK